MAQWQEAVVTNAGVELLARCLSGEQLHLDYAAGGTGCWDGDLHEATELRDQKQQIQIVQQKATPKGRQIAGLITNRDLNTGYQMNQYGIFAHVGENASPVLFAILQDSGGISIPSKTDIPEFHFIFYNIIDFINSQIWHYTIDPTLNKPRIESVDPTESTPGALSQFYINEETGSLFVCVDTGNGEHYTWLQISGGGGMMPQIVADAPVGYTVTCSNGTITLSELCDRGTVIFDIPAFGQWELQAFNGGQVTNTETVTVDSVTQYHVILSSFYATISVTAVPGASIAVAMPGKTYTKAADGSGIAEITVNYQGEYTVTAISGSATSSTETVNVETQGETYNVTVTFITLTVTVASGSLVTAVNNTTILSGISDGSVLFCLPHPGVWNVTATLDDESASGSVNATGYQAYTLSLHYAAVVGVKWDYSNPSTALTRLTRATDPNGHVTIDITSEPSPAIGTSTGSSPFDEIAPWCDMDEFNVISNTLSYRKGEPGFSRTSNDTVVRIPKFYYKREKNIMTSEELFYISDRPVAGMAIHPAFARGDGSGERDYIYVGKYNTIAGYNTRSGAAPLVSITRAAARTGSSNKGSNWWQYDYAAWSAIWMLYLVEFADWDSQSKIGRGVADVSAAVNTGGTDSMAYHTGRAAGTDGQTPVQYRWIENPWGNVRDMCDGFNANERLAYICLDPSKFADDTAVDYTTTGITMSLSGYIQELGYSPTFPFAFLPTVAEGSESTYIPDRLISNAGWRALNVGGDWGNGGYAGLFYFNANNAATSSNANRGTRLLWLP